MKILDIIKTHYGDKFLLEFTQDEDVTIFDINHEGRNVTFIVTNEVANSLLKYLKGVEILHSTNLSNKVFKFAKCEFKANCWEITAYYTMDFETRHTIHL